MSVRIISGNLLTTSDTLIVHQTNCQSTGSKGLAKHIHTKFPYANAYKLNRTNMMGTCQIFGDGINTRYVVALYGQNSVGKPSSYELAKTREIWFQQALDSLGIYITQAQITPTIGFPYQIGCGLAGGNWSNYLRMIQQFAMYHKVHVTIYRII